MAQAKAKPQHRLIHAVMVPLDWLEERSGFVGATKYFLFRKVPRDRLVPHARLGDVDGIHRAGRHRRRARLLLQTIAERGLLVDPVHHQRPDAGLARARACTAGARVSSSSCSSCTWGASSLRRLQVPVGFESAPWRDAPRARDARGLHRLPAPVGSDRLLGHRRGHQPGTRRRPSSGPSSPTSLRGGQRSAPTPSRSSTRCTCCSYPAVLILLITLHIYLVIRLGVSSPPWSKEAAGGEREEVITAKRGLLEPRPRGRGRAAGARAAGGLT